VFLGAFAKLRKATVSFVMSVRLSGRPQLQGLSLNSMFESFSEIRRENSICVKIRQE